ncbi:MAG: ASCH domain-containing protein [Chitinophagaceae bacterium]
MPAYSFKQQFVPYVLDGTKWHTVRSRRKHPAKVGDKVYLYYGLRTKFCKNLRNEVCSKTHSIVITAGGEIIFYKKLLTDGQLPYALINPLLDALGFDKILSGSECDRFAWLDGFRPEGSTRQEPAGSFAMMLDFWRSTHSLPFVGDIIYW